MSENRDRRRGEFSKYDSMPTEALEEILRLDAEAPEEQGSDTELLLYVMGVLADRRNNTNNTGKTAYEAWESFQQHYLPETEEGLEAAVDMKKPVRHSRPWLRRLTAAAAAAVLVLCIPLTANAFGWEEIWNIFARWAKETFSFVSEENPEVTEPDAEYDGERDTLQELLIKNKIDAALVPTWFPDGFELDKVEKDVTPEQKIFRAFYLNGEKELKIRIKSYNSADVYNIEIEEDVLEIYTVSGIEYYIFENVDQIRVIWAIDSYECNISGDLSIDDIKMMIESIGKG